MNEQRQKRLLQSRRWRIRSKVSGTRERPRMSVRFSNAHIYVQFIDDAAGVTLASASTRAAVSREAGKTAANVASAVRLGALAAQAAKATGISRVVFDRSGSRYHGKVKALADAARENGLTF
jgi:large subunit ribosomal protein L18